MKSQNLGSGVRACHIVRTAFVNGVCPARLPRSFSGSKEAPIVLSSRAALEQVDVTFPAACSSIVLTTAEAYELGTALREAAKENMAAVRPPETDGVA